MIRVILIFLAVFVLVYIGLDGLDGLKEFVYVPREKFQNNKFNKPIHRLDYLDEDVLRMYNTNLNQCIEICETDNECKGFVYVPRDDLCKFKTTLDKPIFSRGHISFLKKN